jgi:GNAT superfamily N-acetyltransferase
MSRSGLEFRRTERDDLESEYAVFASADAELRHRNGLEWVGPSVEAWREPHQHLLAEDAERSFVAVDGERVVGYSAALVRSDVWFFSALYVLPGYQARGVGRKLLDLSWGADFRRRITITDAIQPASNGLYARRGLIPTTPILSLSGIPDCTVPPGVTAFTLGKDTAATLDQSAYGFDRAVDHRYWAAHAKATLWLARGDPVAYSYVGGQGHVGPLAGRDGDSAALALHAELARRAGLGATVLLPGTARELVTTALSCGLRFGGPPCLLLLSKECQAPRAVAISDYWLF